MKTRLDYPHTCPHIDKNISHFQSELFGAVEEIVEYFSPAYKQDFEDTTVYKNIIESFVDSIYLKAEAVFEDVRKCNSDIRDHAEKVIDDLADEISDLEEQIKDKDYEIKQLEDKVDDLESQVEYWKERYNDLENE